MNPLSPPSCVYCNNASPGGACPITRGPHLPPLEGFSTDIYSELDPRRSPNYTSQYYYDQDYVPVGQPTVRSDDNIVKGSKDASKSPATSGTNENKATTNALAASYYKPPYPLPQKGEAQSPQPSSEASKKPKRASSIKAFHDGIDEGTNWCNCSMCQLTQTGKVPRSTGQSSQAPTSSTHAPGVVTKGFANVCNCLMCQSKGKGQAPVQRSAKSPAPPSEVIDQFWSEGNWLAEQREKKREKIRLLMTNDRKGYIKQMNQETTARYHEMLEERDLQQYKESIRPTEKSRGLEQPVGHEEESRKLATEMQEVTLQDTKEQPVRPQVQEQDEDWEKVHYDESLEWDFVGKPSP